MMTQLQNIKIRDAGAGLLPNSATMPFSLILIAYSYTPVNSPRAFRWTAIARQWAKQGSRVHVVTAWKPGLARQEIVDGVHVHRVGGGWINRFRRRVADQPAKETPSNSAPISTPRRTIVLKKSARILHNATWKQLYWPDYAYAWYRPALREARHLISNNGFDAIVTVSHPFTGHLAGLNLKREFDLPWLVDIGDPFHLLDGIKPNNTALYRRLNRRAEEAVLRDCDHITVTTDGARALYRDHWPEIDDKIDVIYPLADLDTINDTQVDFGGQNKDRRLRVVHVGNLYRDTRNPSAFFDFMSRLINESPGLAEAVRLDFYGGTDDESILNAAHQLPAKMFEWHGRVSREKALEVQQRADILLYLGNNNSYQLPSKVAEYIALARPVLGFYPDENDQARRFFANCACHLSIDAGRQPFLAELSRWIESVRNMSDADKLRMEQTAATLVSQFSAETISSQYTELITQLMKVRSQ